jgi:photosystem II stability/assembly factor-like uncharacterized protein
MKTLSLNIFLSVFLCSSLFAQWTIQGTLTDLGDYPSISVYGPAGVVVAGGLAGLPKVYKSTNSGVNWIDITGNLISNPEPYSVWAVDGNVIYAADGGSNGGAGGNARVWKTTNGGTTWTNILTTGGSLGFINGIVFSRTMPSFGFIQSDPPNGTPQPFWIAKTTDGGNNWAVTSAPSMSSTYGIFNTLVAIDNQFYGYGVYPDPNVHITTDGGTTWNSRNLGITGNGTYGFAFSSDKTYGIAVTENSLPTIGRTTNGGVNWSPVNTGSVTYIDFWHRMKWVYGTSVCFLTGETSTGSIVKKSTDNGATWVTQTTPAVSGLMNIDLVNSSGSVYAYAVANDGKVIRLQQQLTGINPVNSNIPADFTLHQNYPNPFNPVTKIKFALPNSGNVKLVVFDLLGREVTALVNEQLNPGTYEVDWNASNYPSGVYYYQLIAGEYSETKKMILIK